MRECSWAGFERRRRVALGLTQSEILSEIAWLLQLLRGQAAKLRHDA